MFDTIKVFTVIEKGISYSYYNAKRKEFFYIETDNVAVFNRENSKMFVLDIECRSRVDFEKLMNDFFTCDEITMNAK